MSRSSRRVPIGDFAAAIVSGMREYTEDVVAGIRAEVEDAAEDIKRDVGANSPAGKTGKYAKGWRIAKRDTKGQTIRIVHNGPRYMLVHLLEKGHATRSGGQTRKFPHVRPAADPRLERMVQNVKEIIRRGG